MLSLPPLSLFLCVNLELPFLLHHVRMYSSGVISHNPGRLVMVGHPSFILLFPCATFSGELQELRQGDGNDIYRGRPNRRQLTTLILPRIKKDCRHWENIPRGMSSKAVILLLLSKGSSDYMAGKQHCCCFSPPPTPTKSVYKMSLSFKNRKAFSLCNQKARGTTNTALLMFLNFFWKVLF